MFQKRLDTMSPIGALFSGLVAGAVGSIAQLVFFSATKKIAPETPRDAFRPPEPQQRSEMPTQTVARRFVEGLMHRRLAHKDLGGVIVHVAFGAGWGGLYGLACASNRSLRGPLGALGFATLVWTAGDNVILPAFRLAAWPQAYSAKSHGYAFAAHLVYGAAVWGTLELFRPGIRGTIASFLAAAWTTRKLPSFVRAPARSALTSAKITRSRGERIVEAFR
jgi:hypothetical protein